MRSSRREGPRVHEVAARAGVALWALLAPLLACGPSTTEADETVVRDGTDVVSHEGDVELLAAALVGSSGGSLSLSAESPGAVRPADVGDGAQVLFLPRGCLKTSHELAARRVTYTFADCLGPFGLRRLSGTLTAVYGKGPEGLTLDLASEALAVGRASFRLKARAEITAPSPQTGDRKTTWRAELDGTTARDRPMRRTVERTLLFSTGASCAEATGRSTGSVGGAALEVRVDKVRRCRGACPEAGGKIQLLAADRPVIELTFDGTTEAKVTLEGKQRTLTLACAK